MCVNTNQIMNPNYLSTPIPKHEKLYKCLDQIYLDALNKPSWSYKKLVLT